MNLVAIKTFSPYELCERGEYTAASELAGIRAGEWPENVSGGILARAEALLVAGTITSVAGGIQAGDQIVAKRMLVESIRLFGDDPRADQARCRLARSEYWDGNLDLALEICADLLTADPDTRFRTLLLRAGIYSDQGLAEKAFADLEEMIEIYDRCNSYLKGQFHNQRGRVLRLLEQTDRAIVDYDNAIQFFREIQNLRCEAIAANNLAGVYLETKQFSEAHEYADRARCLFHELGDKTLEAEAWDQTALICLAEGKFEDAERSILQALAIVRQGKTLYECQETYERIKSRNNATMRRPPYSQTEGPERSTRMNPLECATHLIQNNPDNAAVLYDLMVFARMPDDPENDAEMDGVEEMLFGKIEECVKHREDYRRSRLVHPIPDS